MICFHDNRSLVKSSRIVKYVYMRAMFMPFIDDFHIYTELLFIGT